MAFQSAQFQQLFAAAAVRHREFDQPDVYGRRWVARPGYALARFAYHRAQAAKARVTPLDTLVAEQKAHYSLIDQMLEDGVNDPFGQDEKMVDQIIHKCIQMAIATEDWSRFETLVQDPLWSAEELEDGDEIGPYVDMDHVYEIVLYYQNGDRGRSAI